MRVLMETDHALVGCDEENKTVMVIWSGLADIDEFTHVYNNVLRSFKIYFVNRLVNDFTGFTNFNPEQIDFLLEKVFPIAYKCGMRSLINVGQQFGIVEGLTENAESIFTSAGKKISIQATQDLNQALQKINA